MELQLIRIYETNMEGHWYYWFGFDIFDKIRLISEFKGIGILLIRINETNSKEHTAMIRILIY